MTEVWGFVNRDSVGIWCWIIMMVMLVLSPLQQWSSCGCAGLPTTLTCWLSSSPTAGLTHCWANVVFRLHSVTPVTTQDTVLHSIKELLHNINYTRTILHNYHFYHHYNQKIAAMSQFYFFFRMPEDLCIYYDLKVFFTRLNCIPFFLFIIN